MIPSSTRYISRVLGATALAGTVSLAGPVEAASPTPTQADLAAQGAKDIREEAPLTGYTLSAFGASARTIGIAGFASVLGGAGSPEPGGGARLWGSPLDRLTLFVEIDQPQFGELTPSATVAVRIFGDRPRGYAVGAMVSYKTEGFASIAGELEGALLASVEHRGLHASTNIVVGAGLQEPEIDGELKIRLGYDLTTWLRAGADGRFRYRLSGDRLLPGGRVGDFVGGPEIVLGHGHFFAAVCAGPSTVGVVSGAGWAATGTVGGALF